jgi:hypothetical protein
VLRAFAARPARLEVHVAPSRDRFVELAARVLALPAERAPGGTTDQDVQPEVRALVLGPPPSLPFLWTSSHPCPAPPESDQENRPSSPARS